MPEFVHEQFVAGTSAWGSRITTSRALAVGRSLLAAGFTQFDTAPTYGAGYAHYVLNRLARDHPGPVTVDTKYGQLNELGSRGLAKKLLRAPSFGALSSVLWQHPTTDRNAPGFWSAERFLRAFEKCRTDLESAELGVFYYHGPPVPVLGPRTREIFAILGGWGVTLGLASPTMEDLRWLGQNPGVKMVVQLRFAEFLDHHDFLGDLPNAEVRVNGIVRDQARKIRAAGMEPSQMQEIIRRFFVGRPERKFVIGINSALSVSRLRDLAAGTAGSIVMSGRAG